MGLDELSPFDPNKNIIEYMLAEDDVHPLVKMDLRSFADETASESPAPGGGSIAAYLGALGAALGSMVANLSSHKRGWDDRWKEFSIWSDKGQALKDKLLWLVDEDTHAFNRIMDAFKLPKSTDEEKALRSQAIQEATKYAIEIPFQVMQTSFDAFELLEAMAKVGNPNSVSDAGVGALSARSAVIGAYLNVKINVADLKDESFKADILSKAEDLKNQAIAKEAEILQIVESKL